MYESMPQVCETQKKKKLIRGHKFLKEHDSRDRRKETHSVGDGTDSIVRLNTMCGNLDVHVQSAETDVFERERSAYSPAKRIAKLAPVVSLAQMCAGGNHNALKTKDLAKHGVLLGEARDGRRGLGQEGILYSLRT
jgi:hypothetical protein